MRVTTNVALVMLDVLIGGQKALSPPGSFRAMRGGAGGAASHVVS